MRIRPQSWRAASWLTTFGIIATVLTVVVVAGEPRRQEPEEAGKQAIDPGDDTATFTTDLADASTGQIVGAIRIPLEID